VRLLLVGSQELFHLPAGIASVREGINPNRLLQPLQGLLRLFRQAVDPRLRPIPSPGSLSGNENDQDKNADQGGDEYSRIDHLPFLVHSTTSAPDTVSSPPSIANGAFPGTGRPIPKTAGSVRDNREHGKHRRFPSQNPPGGEAWKRK